MLGEITKMSEKNDELHSIYDQQVNSYNFKKSQNVKVQR